MGEKKGMSVIKIKGTSRSTEPAGGGKEQGDPGRMGPLALCTGAGAAGSSHPALTQ